MKKEEQQNRLRRLAAAKGKGKGKDASKAKKKSAKTTGQSVGGGPRPPTLARGKDTTFSNQEGMVDPRDLSPNSPNPIFNGSPLVRGIR